jgi:predicted ATPase/DNA-binding winged helix-turn-helix (wHTH) protein
MPGSASPRVFAFGRYLANADSRQLLMDGAPVKLGARAFDMLLALVERRDRVVHKSELMDVVWPRLVVEENNLQVQVVALRKLLGHDAISTIPGRGYRFTLPVVVDGEAIARQDGSSSAPAATGPEHPGDVRLRPPHLFGRDDDLAALAGVIDRHGLVTVAGAGGMGKTALARGVAQQQQSQHGRGVCWVELAALSDPALVPSAVARALGLALEGTKDPTAAVLEALHGRAALLVLDNAEHLLDSVVSFVAVLRGANTRVRLLVTSQEVLHALDEHVFRLGPLAVPQGDEMAQVQASGAAALFVARASAASPRFTLTEDNREAVADICRGLDGIPLAIELAAARVPLLGVQGVRQRLDERFRVLTAGSRAVLRRHQTLRAALEWSYALLTAQEQRVLRRLGVFSGGFTLEAAQAVAVDEHIDAWELLDHLGGLVDKSLVVAEGDPVPRYRLLETTRLYALERLAESGETEALLRRHAEYALELAEAFDTEVARHGRAARALDRLDQERDNLLHALTWCDRDGGPTAAAIGQRLAGELRYYWPSRGLIGTGIAATLRALDRADVLPGDEHRCKAMGSALQMLSWTRQGGAAEAMGRRLLALGESIGFEPSVGIANCHLGYLAGQRRDWGAAASHFEAALALARRTGSLHQEGNALGGLADMLVCQGRLDEAAARHDELLQLRRRAGHGFNLAVALQQSAHLALTRGDAERCATLLAESQPWVRAAGSRILSWGWCSQVGRLAARRGHWTFAVQLSASSARFMVDDGLRADAEELLREQAEQDSARAALGEAAYEQARASGTALSEAEALDLAARALSAAP